MHLRHTKGEHIPGRYGFHFFGLAYEANHRYTLGGVLVSDVGSRDGSVLHYRVDDADSRSTLHVS